MINQEPSLGSLDRHWSCTYLHALPSTLLESSRCHHMTMMPPILQVGRLTIEDVTKCRMPRITRTAQHSKLAIDLAWEHHTIAVVRQEGILQLMESQEVLRPSHADGRTMITIAPSNIILIAYLAHTRVVAIYPLPYLSIATLKTDGFLPDVPMDGILAKTSMERHATILVITAEHTGEALTKWYNSTIEDAVGVGKMVTLDDWILRIPPKRSLAGGWPLLPRNIGKSRTYNLDFFHCYQKNIVIIRRIIL